MKKIALFMLLMFVVVLAGAALARTAAEELDAVRGYLKTLDAKIMANRANPAKVASLKKEKAATLQRLQVLKARAEAEAMVSEPTPAPVQTPAPAPRPVPQPAAQNQGLFGLGLETAGSIGYVMDKSVLALRADVILDDPIGMGEWVGLSKKAVKYRIGLGYTQGKDTKEKEWKSVPIFVDGLIMIPAEALEGIESYIGGGLNYVVTRSGSKSGDLGGQIYVGMQGDIGLGGKSFVELGYEILRSGKTSPQYSTKGFSVAVGQKIVL